MDLYAVTTQEILDKISRHCPEALSIYLHCLNRVNKEGTYFFNRDEVEIQMSEVWSRFVNNIKKLAREDLLEWQPINKGISITLANIVDYD